MATSNSTDVGNIVFDNAVLTNATTTTASSPAYTVTVRNDDDNGIDLKEMSDRMERMEEKMDRLLSWLDSPSNPDAPAEEQNKVRDVLKEEIKRLK